MKYPTCLLLASISILFSTTIATNNSITAHDDKEERNTPPTKSTTPKQYLRSLNSQGCCSIDFMNCDGTFCGTTKEACENCEQDVKTAWLPTGALPNGSCLKKNADCTNDVDGCCSPGVCIEVNPFYSQCQAVEAPSSNPSAAPSMSPTENKNGCCSLNFKDCDGTWCGSTKDACESCDQNVDVTWLPKGKRSWCLAKWADCSHDRHKCCGPAKCVKVTNEYYQCQPEE